MYAAVNSFGGTKLKDYVVLHFYKLDTYKVCLLVKMNLGYVWLIILQ